MKAIMKCVVALVSIAAVCTAMLALANKFWYVAPAAIDPALMTKVLGDETSTTFEEIELPLDAQKGVKNIFVATNGESAGGYAVLVEGSISYGSIRVLTGFHEGAVTGVALVEISKDAGLWKFPLNDEAYAYFVGKDPNDITAADLKGIGTNQSASLTTNMLISCVKAAYNTVVASDENPIYRVLKKALNDYTVTEFEEISLPDGAPELTETIYRAKNGNSAGHYLVVARSDVKRSPTANKFGDIQMVTAVKPVGDIVEIVGVALGEANSATNLYQGPLNQKSYDYFVGKDPHDVTYADLQGLTTHQSAKYTGAALIACVQAAYDVVPMLANGGNHA